MKNTTLIISGLLLFLLVSNVGAISLGVSPVSARAENVLKGGYYETAFTIVTSGNQPLNIRLQAEEEIKDWVTFNETEFVLQPKSQHKIAVIIQPPADLPTGEYRGRIMAEGIALDEKLGQTGVAVIGGITAELRVTVSGTEVISYEMLKARVGNIEIGYPIKFDVDIMNDGNVRVKPEIKIEVLDEKETNVLISVVHSETEILPTKREEIRIKVPSTGLDVGLYVGRVTVKDKIEKLLFDVFPKGTLALQAELLDLRASKIWLQSGESVKFEGRVKNVGELPISSAKLVGEAYLIDPQYGTEELLGTFESEKLDIPLETEIVLTSFFTPTKPGRYRIKGIVYYAGKKSRPKETIINVLEKPPNYVPYYIAIGVIVVFLVYYLTRMTEDGRTRRFKRIWRDYLRIK